MTSRPATVTVVPGSPPVKTFTKAGASAARVSGGVAARNGTPNSTSPPISFFLPSLKIV